MGVAALWCLFRTLAEPSSWLPGLLSLAAK